MFSSLNAPFIGISQLRRIVLQIARNSMGSITRQSRIGSLPGSVSNASRRSVREVQRARAQPAKGSRRTEFPLAVIQSTDCVGKSVAKRSAGYAIFCDYGGDVAVRSYVEGDVCGADVWGGADSGCVCDFCGGAFFDGDLITGGER